MNEIERIKQECAERIKEYRKNCKHKNVSIFTASNQSGAPMYGIICNNRCPETTQNVLIVCSDCGSPIAEYTNGRLMAYSNLHYISKGAKIDLTKIQSYLHGNKEEE